METKNIVIVGGGAGGLELAVSLARKLKKQTEFNVVLVDREKTHIWKPHLHQIAAGSMYTQSEQLDYLHLANKFGFKFILGSFVSCNDTNKTIHLAAKINSENEVIIPERIIPYDVLVMAIGSTSNDFGTKGVKDFAFSLDNLPTAEKFHEVLLDKVMQKEHLTNNNEPFTITIVGGGATGVELAAELSETIKSLSQFGLDKLKKNPLKLNVVNAADQLLPGLAPKISNGAKEILEDLKVNVLNSAKVIEVKQNSAVIEYKGEVIELPSDMLVWAAGVKSSDILKNIPNVTLTRGNQISVNDNLQAIGNPAIFTIGDCASIPWVNGPKEGLTVPPRAQAAHQMSDYLAKNLCNILKGKKVLPFRYKDFGSLISLGGEDTVGTLMGFLQGKSLFVEGKIAKFMYLNLYHGHQVKINGFWAALGMLLGKSIQEKFKPKVKLY
jgi:NADH dehydrogenase